MMLVLICASVFAYNQSNAAVNAALPGSKSAKSTKTQTATRSHNKAHHVRRNNRQRGHNYYRYANTHAYLKYMGKAINGR